MLINGVPPVHVMFAKQFYFSLIKSGEFEWKPYFMNYFYSLTYVFNLDDYIVVDVSTFEDNYYVLSVV